MNVLANTARIRVWSGGLTNIIDVRNVRRISCSSQPGGKPLYQPGSRRIWSTTSYPPATALTVLCSARAGTALIGPCSCRAA